MSDEMRSYTTRSVATRTPEAQAQIDAAHAMPGAPAMTPEAAAAKILGPTKPAPRGGTP
jgi:hypothetical protein